MYHGKNMKKSATAGLATQVTYYSILLLSLHVETKRDSRHSNNLNGRIQIYVNHKMFHEGSGIDLLVS